jgi:hypothetical protein
MAIVCAFGTPIQLTTPPAPEGSPAGGAADASLVPCTGGTAAQLADADDQHWALGSSKTYLSAAYHCFLLYPDCLIMLQSK